MTKAELRKIYQQWADDEIDNIIVLEALGKFLAKGRTPAPQSNVVVPEGWQLVPIKADVGMIGEWYRYKNGHRFAGEEPARDTSDVGAWAAMLAAAPKPPAEHAKPFQARVQPWMMACFGAMIAGDREERNHRFLEEALELVQSTGCTAHEAHQLVDYVYGRAIGEPHQEVGGVMVTLAALCLANHLDMHEAAETELARIWTKVEAIRAKQAAKPKHSPLPGPTASEGK